MIATLSVRICGLIATPLFDRYQRHQRRDGTAFIGMRLNHELSPKADAPPFAQETGAPEEIALHTQPVEATHVARRIYPAHLYIGREDFELGLKVVHAVTVFGSLHTTN